MLNFWIIKHRNGGFQRFLIIIAARLVIYVHCFLFSALCKESSDEQINSLKIHKESQKMQTAMCMI